MKLPSCSYLRLLSIQRGTCHGTPLSTKKTLFLSPSSAYGHPKPPDQQCRLFCEGASQPSPRNRMSAWQIYSYKDNLTLSKTMRIPSIVDPGDVLIEVHASSVNPIDVMMKGKGFLI